LREAQELLQEYKKGGQVELDRVGEIFDLYFPERYKEKILESPELMMILSVFILWKITQTLSFYDKIKPDLIWCPYAETQVGDEDIMPENALGFKGDEIYTWDNNKYQFKHEFTRNGTELIPVEG